MLQECMSTLRIGKDKWASYVPGTEQKDINKCSLHIECRLRIGIYVQHREMAWRRSL